MKLHIDLHRLPIRMILGIVLIVLLTALSIGVPAVWLLHDRLEEQAWSQLEQGQLATQAFYSLEQRHLDNLVNLTVQRPTFKDLLVSQNWEELLRYLKTFQSSVELDLILVCGEKDDSLVSTQIDLPKDICSTWLTKGFQVDNSGLDPQLWMISISIIQNSGGSPTSVIIGEKIGFGFVMRLRDQTNLDHTIFVNGYPLTTSLPVDRESIMSSTQTLVNDQAHYRYDLPGQRYYAVTIPLKGKDVISSISLSTEGMEHAQRQLILSFILGIVGVSIFGSVIGGFLSQHISFPLVQLAQKANEFKRGELNAPVVIDTNLSEIGQVVEALESSRANLYRTMTALEHEKAWMDHLLESIVEGIMTLDDQGMITYFSAGAEQITGLRRDQAMNFSCDEIFKRPKGEPPFSQSIPLTGARNKTTIIKSDGSQAVLSITKAVLTPSEAENAEFALVFRDVSDEEAVRRILGHFLANVAHEFRTPLSSLAAAIELLLDQAPDLSIEELRILLQSLHLSTLRLQNLVDNLLEGASIEAGRFRVSQRRVDIHEIIQEAIQTMDPLLEKYGQRLIVELPLTIPKVYADTRRMTQVLVNLISNASRYGPAEGNIKLQGQVSSPWLTLYVLDQGPGIPVHRRQEVFKKFTYSTVDNDDSTVGVGLGLSVVKAIVEAHGGQVGVDGNSDGGTTIWFTIPLVED